MVAGLGRPETVAEPRRQGPGVGGLGRHPLGGVREAPHAVRVGQPRLPGPRHLLHQKLRTRPVQHERAEAARAAPPRRHARFRIRGSQKRLVRCDRCTLRVSTASARRSRPARWHGVAFMRRAHGAAGDRAHLADACPLVAGQGRFACAAAAEEAESSGRAPRSLDRGGIDRLPRRQNSGSHGKPVGSRCCRPFTVAFGTFWRRAMCPRKRAASRGGACARAPEIRTPREPRVGVKFRGRHMLPIHATCSTAFLSGAYQLRAVAALTCPTPVTWPVPAHRASCHGARCRRGEIRRQLVPHSNRATVGEDMLRMGMHAQRWQRLRKLCRASMRRALLLPRRSRRSKRGGNARGADAPSRSAARLAMR